MKIKSPVKSPVTKSVTKSPAFPVKVKVHTFPSPVAWKAGDMAFVPTSKLERASVVIIGHDRAIDSETPTTIRKDWFVVCAIGDEGAKGGILGSYPVETLFTHDAKGAKACDSLLTKERAEHEASKAARAEAKAARENAKAEAATLAEAMKASLEAARARAIKTGKTVKVTPPSLPMKVKVTKRVEARAR